MSRQRVFFIAVLDNILTEYTVLLTILSHQSVVVSQAAAVYTASLYWHIAKLHVYDNC